MEAFAQWAATQSPVEQEASRQRVAVLYGRKFSSAKNFVKSDRRAVRQEFIFGKRRSSLVCSSVVPSCEKIRQAFNLVKNCFDESDEIKLLTKISCHTVCENQ